MKRQKLIKEILKRGAVLVRNGAKHDIYETREQIPPLKLPVIQMSMNWSQGQ